MKTLLTLAALFIIGTVSAQLSITTNFRQDAVWNVAEEQWKVLESDENKTYFAFNRELTSFNHITATIESNYTITKWDYNEEDVKYTMTVVSDAGNEYEMIIDGVNNCVAFFYYYGDDYVLVRHTIETTKFEEEE